MKILEMITIGMSSRNFCVPVARELVRRGHSVDFALQKDGYEIELKDGFDSADVLHVHTPVVGFLGRLAGKEFHSFALTEAIRHDRCRVCSTVPLEC